MSRMDRVVVWGSCSPTLMDDLENIQVQASKLVYKLPRNSNVDQLNKRKGWNNISLHYTRRLFKWKPTQTCSNPFIRSNIDVLMIREEKTLMLPSEDYSHEH